MNKHSASKTILLVLYPYPVSEFLNSLIELDYFLPYCDVIVWDISMLTNPTFASALTYARVSRNNIVSIFTWTQFFRIVADLKELSLTPALTIRTFPATNAAEFLIAAHLYFSFRKSPVKQFDVIKGGLPVLTATSPDNSPHKALSTSLIARFKVFIRNISSLQEARSKSKNCRHYFSDSRKNLLRRFDGKFPVRYFQKILEYLSLSEDEFHEIADRFRSPHLWHNETGVWKLRAQVELFRPV